MAGSRGQSETLGLALILGLTLITVTALAIVGGSALDSAQQQIGTQSAEHAMSQFDSRVAMVGLGRSDAQQVRFGNSQQGTYTVEPGTGWLRITHSNYTSDDEEIIYNRSLGSMVYENGEVDIAYQGGGVWRKRGTGSVMVSPPEFHYRGATLTLPILRVQGDGSVSGSPSATVRQINRNQRIYPNTTTSYSNASRPYQNPIGEGKVTVTVHSEYYRAWADYFRGRTDGNVSVDPANKTATMELIALGTYGDFDMPLDGNSMTFRGVRTHQISDFSITLFHDDDDDAKFNNLEWSLWATSGSKEWEMHVQPLNSTNDGDAAEVMMYYSDGGEHEGWYTDSTFHFEEEISTDWNNDGDYDDKRLVINLTSTDNFTYTDLSTSPKPQKFNSPDDLKEPATFSGHVDWEPESFNESDETPIQNATTHYMAEMGPEIEMFVEDKNSDTVEESISYGTIEYGGKSGFFLTYLHVTENNVNVSVR